MAGMLLGGGLFALWRLATHNEGAVEAGKLYRSAQLSRSDLQKEVTDNGIKTIINLSGENHKAVWYVEELALCQEQHIRHVDIHLSAQHLPLPSEISKLLESYREVPRPILLHCRSGSDRTGLAAALYLIDQDHVPWNKAEEALSVSYGHFAIYPYFEMDEFVQLYGEGSKKSLLNWTREDYPSVYEEERKESRWHEMWEPWESFFTGHT
jgi:protein tyrosine/serine phosphatase